MVTDLIRDIGDPQAGVPHIGLGEFDPPAVDTDKFIRNR